MKPKYLSVIILALPVLFLACKPSLSPTTSPTVAGTGLTPRAVGTLSPGEIPFGLIQEFAIDLSLWHFQSVNEIEHILAEAQELNLPFKTTNLNDILDEDERKRLQRIDAMEHGISQLYGDQALALFRVRHNTNLAVLWLDQAAQAGVSEVARKSSIGVAVSYMKTAVRSVTYVPAGWVCWSQTGCNPGPAERKVGWSRLDESVVSTGEEMIVELEQVSGSDSADLDVLQRLRQAILAWAQLTGEALEAAAETTLSPLVGENCITGDYIEEFRTDGQIRQYRLHVPTTYQAGQPVPLVLGFHGNAGRAEQFEGYTGLSMLADQEGFVAAYPQGAGDPPTWEIWEGSRDVSFVRDLVDSLITRCSVDKGRIYAVGHSLGGGMTNRIGCDLPDIFSAIGPVAGVYQYSEACSPSKAVAVVAVHGTADPYVFYNGVGNLDSGPPGAFFTIGTPIPEWASTWAKRDGCTDGPSTVFQQGQVMGQAWSGCEGGAQVLLYTVQEGGHEWPAGEFDATLRIWEFFSRGE